MNVKELIKSLQSEGWVVDQKLGWSIVLKHEEKGTRVIPAVGEVSKRIMRTLFTEEYYRLK